jgi:predicted RNase H-like nuclease (RuvC/YqgF family)
MQKRLAFLLFLSRISAVLSKNYFLEDFVMKKMVIVCCSVIIMMSVLVAKDDMQVKKESQKKVDEGQVAASTNVPFSPQASQDFMRRVAETSRRIEELRAQIEARKAEIFSSNEEVKKLFERQKELQKKINAILDQDKELSELKIQKDIITSVMPQTLRRRNLPPSIP